MALGLGRPNATSTAKTGRTVLATTRKTGVGDMRSPLNRSGMQMSNSRKAVRMIAVAALAMAVLVGCGQSVKVDPTAAKPSSSSPAASPTPSPSPSTSDDPFRGVPTEDPEPTISEGPFGQAGNFTQEEIPFAVTVGKAVKAKCQYSSIGCDKPETGDRVVNVPITIKNNGKEAIEVSEGMFVIEFADGTRMESTDGNAHQYGPDNTLGYDQKIRPGGTLKTSLTFEAPAGAFSIVLLDSTFGGEDLYIWK